MLYILLKITKTENDEKWGPPIAGAECFFSLDTSRLVTTWTCHAGLMVIPMGLEDCVNMATVDSSREAEVRRGEKKRRGAQASEAAYSGHKRNPPAGSLELWAQKT